MVEARPKRLYICLRCGNKFWSRAKKPQCPVCKSKRVMLYEDFEKLSDKEKAELLPALFKVPKKGGNSAKEGDSGGVKEGEDGGELEELVEGESKEVKSVEVKGVKQGEKGVKRGDSERVKESEKVKGERVKLRDVIESVRKESKEEAEKPKKRGFRLPGSFKFWFLVGTVVSIYIMYKLGMLEEILGFLRPSKKEEKEEGTMVVRSSSILGKIESNLRRG